MTSLLDDLRRKYKEALCEDCKEQACELKLAGLPRRGRLILNCNSLANSAHAGAAAQRCDRLVIHKAAAVTVAAVELKRGQPDTAKAAEQLQGGARLAQQIADGHQVDVFLPVLLSGGAVRPMHLKILRRKRVTFRNISRMVILDRCGVSWQTLISKHRRRYTVAAGSRSGARPGLK